MNTKYLLTILYALIYNISIGYGQSNYNQTTTFLKSNSVWMFGNRAGLDFNGTLPTAGPCSLNISEGTASVADPISGKLLFYSDGKKCWDANHKVMPNGDSLWGNSGSITQGVCIVPVIGDTGKYYLFSLTGIADFDPPPSSGNLFYSIVDMRLNGNTGDVIASRKNRVLSRAALSEGMIAVPGNDCDIWLLTHEFQNPVFYAYHITERGIDSIPVVSTAGTQLQGIFAYVTGGMAISPSRTQLAICSHFIGSDPAMTGALLCRFDPSTGVVSGGILVQSNATSYGACFSPDETKLYIQGNDAGPRKRNLSQYDISTLDSTVIVSSRVYLRDNIGGGNSLLLKLYNGKIYSPSSANSATLDCIHDPNLPGAGCNYQQQAILLSSSAKSSSTLPNDVVFPFQKQPDVKFVDTLVCTTGDIFPNIILSVPTGFGSYQWDNGDIDSKRPIDRPGTYWVYYGNGEGCHQHADTFVVRTSDVTPLITINEFELSTTMDYKQYQWLLNGVEIAGATNRTYRVQQNGDYSVIVTNEMNCSDTSALYKVDNVAVKRPAYLANKIALYPNPSRDILYIQYTGPVNVAINSMEGRSIARYHNCSEINVRDFPLGTYVITVSDQDATILYVERFVKW